MGLERILERRAAERRELIERADVFVRAIPTYVGLHAAVVFGSVARGDFNLWSDVDVLIVAQVLPERWIDRVAALGDAPARVSPLAWSLVEWRKRLLRRDPIAVESRDKGVWLRGSLPELVGARA